MYIKEGFTALAGAYILGMAGAVSFELISFVTALQITWALGVIVLLTIGFAFLSPD